MTEIYKPFRSRFSGTTDSILIVGKKASLIKLNSQFSLFFFGEEIWKELLQNLITSISSNMNDIKKSMLCWIFSISTIIEMKFKIKLFCDKIKGSWISHFNGKTKDIRRSSSSSVNIRSFNGNASFSIYKSCKVRFVHPEMKYNTNYLNNQDVFIEKLPNSVEPRPDHAEGNTEPSRKVNLPGVCREHRATPKGMMCAELHSNMESMAEMTIPCENRVTKLENQDARTALILFQGNLTTNNRRMHGVVTVSAA